MTTVLPVPVAILEAVRGSPGFEVLFAQVAGCFRSEASLGQAREYLAGLLSDITRKNGWTLAEHAGDQAPVKMQRLLSEYA